MRNPMYVSLTMLYLGLSLWLKLAWPLMFLPITILIVHYRVILKEERYLEIQFGVKYLDYKNNLETKED